MFAAFHLSSLL